MRLLSHTTDGQIKNDISACALHLTPELWCVITLSYVMRRKCNHHISMTGALKHQGVIRNLQDS